MKKIASVLALVVLNVFFSFRTASAGDFLMGMVAGSLLSSGNQTVAGNADANVMYQMANASERVIDPLSVQFASTQRLDFSQSEGATSIRGLFRKVIDSKLDPSSFEIIQVIRVISPENAALANFWFVYTKKDNIKKEEVKKPAAKK